MTRLICRINRAEACAHGSPNQRRSRFLLPRGAVDERGGTEALLDRVPRELLAAQPQWSAYAASKHGLRALADALRAEEAEHGVRVSSVYPGRTATPMQEEVHRQEGRDYDPGQWIHPGTVAATILHVLDLPRDATVPDVTVSPGPA